MKKVIFINSHPIQYFTPMYKYMNEHDVETEVWYGTEGSSVKSFDKQFGIDIKWDIDLLTGYKYRFFKNYSPNPGHLNGFMGLMNFGMISALRKIPPSIIVVHGWHYLTNFLILFLGSFFGHKICIRCEAPENQERQKKGFAQRIKRVGLQYFLFPRVDYFLYLGSQNRLFYKNLGVAEQQLVSCPTCIDNARFQQDRLDNMRMDDESKRELGILPNRTILLFAGKYIEKKRPVDVIKAFSLLPRNTYQLVMIGEGHLRPDMEKAIAKYGLQDEVNLTGFINQTKIPKYYSAADVFILASGLDETWGLVVNEAMNFALTLVVSDIPGSGFDLVREGENGFIFPTGDIESLARAIQNATNLSATNRPDVERISKELLDIHGYGTVTESLRMIASK